MKIDRKRAALARGLRVQNKLVVCRLIYAPDGLLFLWQRTADLWQETMRIDRLSPCRRRQDHAYAILLHTGREALFCSVYGLGLVFIKSRETKPLSALRGFERALGFSEEYDRGYCFDDLGAESSTTATYGTKIVVMREPMHATFMTALPCGDTATPRRSSQASSYSGLSKKFMT